MKKTNNKGFSLAELLIALAIASIVLAALTALIQQSVRSFSRQTISAQLQSDADLMLNQVENNIMEAQLLMMCNNGEQYDYYLTEVSQTGNDKYNGYVYDKAEKILYYVKDYNPLSTLPIESTNASILSENVDDFNIKVYKGCVSSTQIVTETMATGQPNVVKEAVAITDNIQVVVNVKMMKQKYSREVSRTVSMRNSIFGADMTDQIYVRLAGDTSPVRLKDCTIANAGSYIDN